MHWLAEYGGFELEGKSLQPHGHGQTWKRSVRVQASFVRHWLFSLIQPLIRDRST
jgi:hypothetical protein